MPSLSRADFSLPVSDLSYPLWDLWGSERQQYPIEHGHTGVRQRSRESLSDPPSETPWALNPSPDRAPVRSSTGSQAFPYTTVVSGQTMTGADLLCWPPEYELFTA